MFIAFIFRFTFAYKFYVFYPWMGIWYRYLMEDTEYRAVLREE